MTTLPTKYISRREAREGAEVGGYWYLVFADYQLYSSLAQYTGFSMICGCTSFYQE
jgi:hypothetical protein